MELTQEQRNLKRLQESIEKIGSIRPTTGTKARNDRLVVSCIYRLQRFARSL